VRFDPVRAVTVLERHAVKYVLIGGVAANAHGSPSITRDIDICHERSWENLQRLAEALVELEAKLRGAPEDVPFILDAKALEIGDQLTFTTLAGDFDCRGYPAGTGGYEELIVGATKVDFDGLEAAVASVDDLIRMKRAAGRPKDRIEAEILGALREEIEKRESR
jgi:hypothetical protein